MFPTRGLSEGVRFAFSRQWILLQLPCITCHLFVVTAGAIQHIYLDLPRSWSDEPKASFKTWRAATPAMTIMEPRATYCMTIAMRSLPQFFAID